MAFVGTLATIKMQGTIKEVVFKKFRQVELTILSNGNEYMFHTTKKQCEKHNFYVGKDLIFWMRSTEPMLFEVEQTK